MTGVQFEINVIDNMSAVLDELAERTEGIHQTYGNAEAAAEQLREAQEKVKDSTDEVSDALMKQQINAIGAMTAINTTNRVDEEPSHMALTSHAAMSERSRM